MPEADRPTTSATEETVATAPTPLVGALLSLYRAYQKTSIYPAGHPAVPEALSQAITGFQAALVEHGSITVRVARGKLLFGDEPLTDGTDTLGALGQLLYDLDVAGIVFHVGLTLEELETFIHELGNAKRDGLTGTALASALDHGQPTTIELRAVDYSAMQFQQGTRDPLDEETRREVWENLAKILTDPETAPVELSPTELAEEITHEIKTREGTGVGLLQKRMHRLHETARDLAPEQRAAIQERIASFVSALSPKLRQDLLRVDPSSPDPSLQLMTQLAEGLPESDLLRALRQLDSIGARLPDQLMTLLNKLVRISRKHPSLATGLKKKLEDWGVDPEVLTGSKENLQAALQEVFQRKSRTDYIPQPHKVLLDELSRNHVDGGEFQADGRYRDPRDAHDVRLHAAQIATKVVGGRGGGPHRAGIFAFLASAADSLIEQAQFEVLHDAAVSARTYSLLKTETESTHCAARGYLNEFTSERRLQQILEYGCTAEGFSKDALNLLALGGVTALDRVLSFLEPGPPKRVAAALIEFAQTREPELVAEVLEQRMGGGWQVLRPVFPLLRAMPVNDALTRLETLASHEEGRVRRQALALLCELDERPASPLCHLERALRDPNRRVATLGIQRISVLDGDEVVELLGRYVECDLEGLTPRPDFARRAAQTLLRRGEAGTTRLCQCLARLGRSCQPGRIRVARAVSETLKPKRSEPGVRRCLRRWRFSPCGLASLLLPRGAGADEAASG